jgi:predicted DCC family thiol-disulfide oxidoreductase YuxK
MVIFAERVDLRYSVDSRDLTVYACRQHSWQDAGHGPPLTREARGMKDGEGIAGVQPLNQTIRAIVVYDGECIFCSNYVKFLKLREAVGPVELIDARSDDPRVTDYWNRGYDLNDGMIFEFGGQTYHGDRAVNALALLSGGSSLFNRINRLLLANATLARIAYPALRFGRNVTLRLRGQNKLAQSV